jgi:hypothetical protein
MTRPFATRSALLLLVLALLPAIIAAVPRQEDYHDRLGREVLEAIRVRSYSKLQALTPPTPEVWRKLAPEELGKLSDREIGRKLRKNYYPKLRRDFNGIMQSARSRKVDLSKLEFIDVRLHTLDSAETLIGMEILYEYNGSMGRIAISAGGLDGKFYLHEILLSHDVFARLFEK